ncbi:MAG: NAD(P)-dependent oxidoreductase [Fibrobacteres bacterium]|nr:NAD(P)-dependent oxidoreductase [Fibrobacterota bacterium]
MTESKPHAQVLITGASGFIGTNLIEAISDAYPDIVNMDIQSPMNPSQGKYLVHGDILNEGQTLEVFRKVRPTHVIHLAARCDCDENTTVKDGYKANTVGTENVLKAVKAVGTVRRLVVTSTQFVFNKKEKLPESDRDYAPKTVYGQSKIITEQLTRDAGLGCCWTLIRPTNVWGPWHIRHTKQFFRILRAGLYFHPGREPVMRSYAYVGNVVDQIVKILEADESKVNGKAIYVGDAPLDLYDWVNGFSKSLLGKPVRVVPRPLLRTIAGFGDVVSKATGKDFFITSSRFRSMTDPYLTPMEPTFEALGPPRYSMADGIRLTTKWLREFESSGLKIDGNRPMTA